MTIIAKPDGVKQKVPAMIDDIAVDANLSVAAQDAITKKHDILLLDDAPTDGATTYAISSDWAYNYVKEKEEEQELADLETSYNTIMANERYSSDRRGYKIR